MGRASSYFHFPAPSLTPPHPPPLAHCLGLSAKSAASPTETSSTDVV